MWDKYSCELTLIEDMLGTVPKDPKVYGSYIRTKTDRAIPPEGTEDAAPEGFTDEQVDENLEDKGWTGFYIDEQGRPLLLDYQVKGFLKESGNTIKDVLNLKALRSHIDNEVFVYPRKTVLGDKVDGDLERPLRAMTMQGPRVTVVRSDFIKAGTKVKLEFRVLKGSRITEDVLRSILDYGEAKGLGQWRNGSFGRFTYTLEAMV